MPRHSLVFPCIPHITVKEPSHGIPGQVAPGPRPGIHSFCVVLHGIARYSLVLPGIP